MVTWSNELVFTPHEGVGPLRFGMPRGEVHRVCGAPTWRDEPDELFGSAREQFESHRLFVDFRRDDRCSGVELYPDARVLLDERNLMAMTYRQLVMFLHSRGVSVVEKGDGFRCDDLGLACYAPQIADPDLPDAPIESLLVYERGYYDELDVYLANMNQ